MDKRRTQHTSESKLALLEQHLPPGTLHLLRPFVAGYRLVIKIKKARASKFGDYKPLKGKKWDHQITLNNDLNSYAFLITLLHELAHMYCQALYNGRAKPHGKLWKKHYASLLHYFMTLGVFPRDLQASLECHLHGPTASSCSDQNLFMALKKYDKKNNSLVLVEHLSDGEHFRWRNGLIFRKAGKLRKRYRCLEVRSRRVWFFHPMAEVERLDY
jgi:SprT protein